MYGIVVGLGQSCGNGILVARVAHLHGFRGIGQEAGFKQHTGDPQLIDHKNAADVAGLPEAQSRAPVGGCQIIVQVLADPLAGHIILAHNTEMSQGTGIFCGIAVDGQVMGCTVVDGHGHPRLQVFRFIVRPGHIVIIAREDDLNGRIHVVQFFAGLECQGQCHVFFHGSVCGHGSRIISAVAGVDHDRGYRIFHDVVV